MEPVPTKKVLVGVIFGKYASKPNNVMTQYRQENLQAQKNGYKKFFNSQTANGSGTDQNTALVGVIFGKYASKTKNIMTQYRYRQENLPVQSSEIIHFHNIITNSEIW